MPSRLLRGVGLFWPYGWSPHAVSSGPQAAYRSLMQGDAAGIPLGAASPPKELRRKALHALRSALGAGSLRSMVSGRPAAASGRSARAVDCTHGFPLAFGSLSRLHRRLMWNRANFSEYAKGCS